MSVPDTEDPQDPAPKAPGDDFERAAAGREVGAAREFVSFLAENKRWWLVPLVVTLGLIAVFLFLGSGPLAPFVYTLF